MSYPKFYDEVQTIKVKDPLSAVLGAFSGGEYEFNYIDAVKLAGHSCPTVAGAYLITAEALKALYGEETVIRGNIKVEFKENLKDGVAGVIGNVVSQITGSTDKSGFKGLAGKFARHSLMDFNSNINSSARFTRVDNGKSVDVSYDPSSVMPSPSMQPLMQKMMSGNAEPSEMKEFGELWQDRVERIFQNSNNVIKIVEL
ncbi:FmdE family protein [Sulfurimonas sp.]|uniref:FmdE family protein n=1 Tax=Sulfurimonas sp. TaxID=2022749 RepID=UPI002B47D54F|nr:FmdE family protein [Sulfurimonas sp.]